MSSPAPSMWKAVFVFFAGIPYAVFRIVYFVATLRRRIRKISSCDKAHKKIQIHRLCDTPISIFRAVELVDTLRARDGHTTHPKHPSIFDMFEELWSEGLSECWKLPTVRELMQVRDEVAKDLATIAYAPHRHVVSAIDEDSHMFVLYDVCSGKIADVHPKNTHELFRGNAPDSEEHAFAYAVSVSVITGVE